MIRRSSKWGVLILLVVGLACLQLGCGLVSRITPAASPPTVSPQPATDPTARPTPKPAASGVIIPALPGPGSAGQEAALLPDARQDLAGLAGIPSYTMAVDIDYAAGAFRGASRVSYTNQETVPLKSLYFRLLPNAGKSYGGGSLEVTQVKVGGQPAGTRLSLFDSVLEVALAQPLEAGRTTLVEMAFSGEVPLDFGGESNPDGYGIYNLSQGVLALSGWYPILAVYDANGWNLDPVSAMGDSVYSDMAFYSVDVTASSDLVLATSGVLVEESGERRRFVSGPSRDFFMIMSPDFQVSSLDVGGVRLSSYSLPGHAGAGEVALAAAAGSLEVYNHRFGAYPYTELDIVEAPMRNASGVEYPGVFLVGSDLYTDPDQLSFTITTAHEVAHQWWYNLVGNDVFAEPWLDESLATYSSNIYLQETYGEDAYQGYASYWLDRVERLRADGEDDVVTRPLAYFESLENPAVYSAVTYNKGALFLKSLREEIGDQAFFAALQAYYAGHKYRITRTDDLLEAFETAAGRQLDDLYDEWLYSAHE